MAIINSGTIALQDAGTNPTSGVLLSTTINIGNFSTDGYQSTREQFSESGFNYFIYFATKIFDGIWYGVRNPAATPAMEDNTTSSDLSAQGPNLSSSFNSNIGTAQMNASHGGQAFDALYGAKISWDHSVTDTTVVGSLGTGNFAFTDNSGTSQTVTDILWLSNTDADTGTSGNLLVFAVDANTSNADTVFVSISVGGQTFTRSSATSTTSTTGGRVWYWVPTTAQLSAMGTSGSKALAINGTVVSKNNGIAEEFGGADSSSVAMSHYYKNLAATGDNIQHATAGIPTSGTIKFSDFLGKTFTPFSTSIVITGAERQVGKFGNRYGFESISPGAGTLVSPNQPMTVSPFGSPSVTILSLVYSLPGHILAMQFTINSGTVSTSGWNTLKLSKSGSSDITLNRSNASANVVSGTTYTVQWGPNSADNNTTAERNANIAMLRTGTITGLIS